MAVYGVDITWSILGTLAILSVYWIWSKTRRPYTKYNIPPFPVKPWPFVGHAFMMMGNLRQLLKDWKGKAGDIYSIDFAGEHLILVNDFKAMKEIWIKHGDNITNSQHSFGDELLDEYDTGIFAARDDNWREQRATSLSVLRSLGLGKNIMAEKITEEVLYFTEKLAEFKGRPENILILTHIAVSNVICSISVGKRFEYDDPYFVRLMNHIKIMAKYYFHVMVLTSFKVLCYFPGDLFHVYEWANANKEVNDKFSKVFVRKCKDEFNENEEPSNFIAGYLAELRKKQDKNAKTYLNEKNLITIVRNFFLAGTETTSTTILWFLVFILNHPEVQEKVYKEIEKHIGTSRIPNMSDKPKLPYLNAVIMEVQRLSSLIPVGFRREISATFEACGFTFPKGSKIWPVFDSVHFDKKTWGDPDNFRPERFIDENGALINREELIPFGIGRRMCLGESMAKMELFIFMSAMFQRFRIEPAKPGEPPSTDFILGSTVVPLPFKVRFIERNR